MSKDDKQRILATNRLLEILRAERGAGGTDGDSLELDEVFEADNSIDDELTYQEATPHSKVETPKPDIFRQTSVVEPQVESFQETSEEHPRDRVRELEEEFLKDTETDPYVTRLAEVLAGAEKSAGKEIEQQAGSSLADEMKDDLLLKTKLPDPMPESDTGDLVLKDDFNESLVSSIETEQSKSTLQKFRSQGKKWFSNSFRKITFFLEENSISLLQTNSKLDRTEVEQLHTFDLPYDYKDGVITNINELLEHVLDNKLNSDEKKLSFGSYFSTKTPSKTLVVKSPKLKRKELKDLVEWNANKNLPFSTDSKNLNWEIHKAKGDSETQSIVIGITEKDSVNAINSIFYNGQLDMRLTSTLSILLWKSFVKNYPDKHRGSYVLVHIGESKTSVIVVTDHVLQFTRKIALGAKDFQKVLIKKIGINESGQKIDEREAKKILLIHGYPKGKSGISADTNIDLNKLTVATQPIVERIISELTRTLNYFKNQNPELEWKEIFFSGLGASFPGLLEAIKENMQLDIEIFNPVRIGNYSYREGNELVAKQYPQYAMNFALAMEEMEHFNIIPERIKENYNYLFRSKVIAAVLAILVPVLLFTALMSKSGISSKNNKIQTMNNRWDKLSESTRDYQVMLNDIETANSFNHLLLNDNTYAENQIKLLKLFSSIVPKEIKLTLLEYHNKIGTVDSLAADPNFRDFITVVGMVKSDPALSEIFLTDFILQLEELPYFAFVETASKTYSEFSPEHELLFRLKVELTE